MLTQALAQQGVAVIFVARLQNEMLGRWLENWAAIMAADGRGPAQPTRTLDEPGPRTGIRSGPTNGPARRPARKSVSASPATDSAPPSTPAATSGRRLAMTRDDEEALILHRAYLKWLGEGRPDGHHLRHYFEAEREVRG